MKIEPSLELKVKEIVEELKKQALWKKQTPDWISTFPVEKLDVTIDFFTWLQFVFLPNCLLAENREVNKQHSFVLKAKKLFSSDRNKENLLRLFIELDSLI